MRPVFKVITAILTAVYTGTALLTTWSLYRGEHVQLFSYGPMLIWFIGLIGFGLLVFYSNHLAENEDVGRMSRILWFIRFYLFSFIAFPIYWVAFILRSVPGEEEEEDEAN